MGKKQNIDISTDLGGIKLNNPVLTASGTFGYGLEYNKYLDLNQLGGIVVKGLSMEPKDGNPPPRIWETAAGMLNSIGLQNIGIEEFIDTRLPLLKTYNTKIFVNIFGNSIEEYCRVAERLSSCNGVSAIEMNISCPNIKKGGITFGSNPKMTYKVVSAVSQVSSLPLFVKLSPNVTDIKEFVKASEEGGANGISLINTLIGMAIDIDTGRPRLKNITGGLSGPAIKPVALRMVWEAYNTTSLPIIGIGGITTYKDAIEFMIAGASAVQVGSANFIKPDITIDIINGIKKYCIDKGLGSLSEITGSVHLTSAFQAPF